jgi:2-haloacid dehalogenase
MLRRDILLPVERIEISTGDQPDAVHAEGCSPLALSNKRLKVEFDTIITAQQARSYKPSLNNFRIGLDRVGVPRHEILHVAQSLFHDHVPAKQMGLTTVWINRRHHKQGFGATPPAHVKPDYEFHDLQSFAIAAE